MRKVGGWFVGALVLVATMSAAEAKGQPERARKQLAKKVFFSESKKVWVPNMNTLVEKFSKNKEATAAKVKRVAGADKWNTTLFAFFKKKPLPGPVTIWFYDKSDKASLRAKEPVHVTSIQSTKKDTLIYAMELYGDDGFNKNRTYVVRVGQIVGRRHRVYASGEITLTP